MKEKAVKNKTKMLFLMTHIKGL